MTDQNESLHMGDKMVTVTKPSPEAQAYIDKLDFAFHRMGFDGTLTVLPGCEAMLGRFAHCIANKRFDPVYNVVFDDISMFLMLQVKARAKLIEEIKAKNSLTDEQLQSISAPLVPIGFDDVVMQEVMPQAVGKAWCDHCQKHHDINTQPAKRIALTVIRDQNEVASALVQFLVAEEHDAQGMHVISSAGEVDHLISALQKIREKIGNQKAQS